MATKPQVQANDQAMDAMAEEGRVTDDVMAHLTEGEIVIPLAIAHNRRAVQQIAMMFELAGLDFAEFVVGSPQQKINPETGHPEFWGGFSLGSAWKAVTQPVKTAVDVTKDVVNTGTAVTKDVVNTTVNVTKDVVNTTANVVNTGVNTATNVAKDVVALDPVAVVKDVASGTGTAVSQVGDGVKAVGSDVVAGVKDVGSDVVAGTKQVLKDAYTGAQKTLAYAMDALGILPHVPSVNSPSNNNGGTAGATVTQGDQQERRQAVTDVQAAAGGGSSSLTPRTVAGPDNDYKLNKSAVLGL